MFGINNHNKLLKRKTLLKSIELNSIWKKTINLEDALNILNILEEKLSNYKFEIDNDFIMNSRRTALKDMTLERLNSLQYSAEKTIKDSMFNFLEFISDEYDGNWAMTSRELNLPINEVIEKCEKYRKKAIISLQEKDIIIDMITKMKQFIINSIQ